MLISVCQGTFNGAHAFQGTAVQTANFIQMKGACVCRFCFRGLLRVRPLRSLLFVWVRFKGCAFCRRSLLLFARGCACVRLHAVWGCFLPFARLFLLLQYFAHLARFRAFMWLFLQPRLQPILCSLRSEIQRLGGAKDGSELDKPPASVGAFYSLRKPSASRCNFSAIR